MHQLLALVSERKRAVIALIGALAATVFTIQIAGPASAARQSSARGSATGSASGS